jgi:hypothetical protein
MVNLPKDWYLHRALVDALGWCGTQSGHKDRADTKKYTAIRWLLGEFFGIEVVTYSTSKGKQVSRPEHTIKAHKVLKHSPC